jgi:hypothetical protein
MKTKIPVLALGISSALLAGCGGGGNSPPTTGTVSAHLTDAPACGYDHVFVTVTQVSINSNLDGTGSWNDINLATPKKIDLLSLTNGALEDLGQKALPAGTYQQLRLVLVPNVNGSATFNNSVVPSGQTAEVALKTPSAAQSGIKVNTRAPFTVQPGTLVDLVLDFNACKSIVTTGSSNGHNGASGYLLKPVITATTLIVSGKIDGYVDAADASTTTVPGALVFAEQNGVIVRGTVADSVGHFILSPLEQSSGVGNYDVVIVNGSKATDIVNSVPVTAQATTSLSTSTAPFVLAASTTGAVSGTVNAAASASLDARQFVNGLPYVIAATNADSTTGAYSFTLPVAAPQVAPYSATLPITLAPVTVAAGQYTIRATSAAGNIADSQPTTVTTGSSTTVNFANLQ